MDGFAQTIGLTLGWLMLGWVGLQAMAVAIKTSVRRARRKRRYAADRAEFCRRVETAAQVGRASKSIAAWNGWRKFRVAAIVDEAQDVKSYYFTPEDGRPLAPFAPGQYLTFRLPMAGESAPLVRCYSLSDRPRQDYFRVTVKRIPAPLNQPESLPGRGSSYFHNHVQVGDVLEVRAPAGTFLIDPAATEPIVLFGAGIGVTPLLSMLEAIVQTGPTARSACGVRISQRRRAPVQRSAGGNPCGESADSVARELFVAATERCAVSRLQPSRPRRTGARAAKCCHRTTIGSMCAGRDR